MSEDKHFENDPERTLITLEQLSQTIEVMTSVVNRLRQHLSEQLHAQMEEQQEQKKLEDQHGADLPADAESSEADGTSNEQEAQKPALPAADHASEKKKDSFVVEIRQQNGDPTRKNGKTLH